MGAKQILALYDQDRQEARLFGMQREETPSLVRHISPNGDGLNEVFHIGCIDMFIGNNVRIYNRSGQLVYEIDDYDNIENAFDGIGNRGVYLSSRDVPDGTYFYVINKKDGSRPVSGYLEVMR